MAKLTKAKAKARAKKAAATRKRNAKAGKTVTKRKTVKKTTARKTTAKKTKGKGRKAATKSVKGSLPLLGKVECKVFHQFGRKDLPLQASCRPAGAKKAKRKAKK